MSPVPPRKSPPIWLVLCAPLLANVFFGFYPVAIKMFVSSSETTEKANSIIFTLYRGIGAVPVLFLASYYCEGRTKIPDFQEALTFLLTGLFGAFLGQLSYIMGVHFVGPDISSAMQPLIAIWTAIIAILCGVEKVPSFTMHHTYAKIFGVLISIGGVTNIFSGDPFTAIEGQRVFGYLALLFDTFCGAVYYTLQKKLIFNRKNCVWRDYPIATTAYTYLSGVVFMALVSSYFLFTEQASVFLIPPNSLPALAYAVFFVSAVSYSLVAWANKHIPPSNVTALWPVQILVAVITAYFVLGEELTLQQCLGAAMIVIGLACVLYSNHVDEKISKNTQPQEKSSP